MTHVLGIEHLYASITPPQPSHPLRVVVSDLIRKNRLFVPVVSLSVLYGIIPSLPNSDSVNAFNNLSRLLANIGSGHVLPFDLAAARAYGFLAHDLHVKGQAPDMEALQVAACAHTAGFTVITSPAAWHAHTAIRFQYEKLP